MSSAFIKEEAGERWTPPAPLREYKILLGSEVLRETDDLLDALQWSAQRPVSGLEIRTREGRLLAVA
ncbi:hypothetical protein [Deinococcus sp.]|uniref:hypothetical protein n=1 Tax=Deinococcus sp. TaxID=47478 RepID=UPI0025C0B2A8|nr:hypothetical protein [Deinococcus sp.]